MKPIFLSSLAIFVFSFSVVAQVTVESDISTDTVNFFGGKQVSEKSGTIAMVSSLILPGAGHYYLDRQQSALAYFTVDALAIFGAIFCETYSSKLANNASTYASIYANAHGGAGADARYWQSIGEFMDVDGYNRVQDLNRIKDQKYISQNLSWHWADESFRDEYNKIRQNSQRFHVTSTFFLGALLLDRIIAFVDTRSIARNTKTVSGLQLQPEFAATPSSVSLSLRSQF